MHHGASKNATKAYKFGFKPAAIFLRTGKKTKLLEYKGKKFKHDNEVTTHEDGTFEFISVTEYGKQPAKADKSKSLDTEEASNDTSSGKNKDDVSNVVYEAIKETASKPEIESIAVAAMPKPKGGGDTTITKKGGK